MLTVNTTSGQPRHPRPGVRSCPPPACPTRYRTAIDAAARVLAPWTWGAYPGVQKIMQAALLGRAAVDTIKDWRRGRYKTPQWARDLLLAAIDARMAELQHAKALLEKEKASN